MSNVNVTVDSA